MSFGILSVSVIAASSHAGSPATGGLLIAALSAGAIVGGLALGACDWRAGTAGAAVAVLAIDGLLILPLAAVGENLGLLAAMLVLTGSTRALVLAALNLRVVHSVPAHAEVEAYAWLIAATVAGLAIGPAVGGQLIDAAGISTGFLAAAAAALVGAAALLVDVTDAPTAPATPT